MIYMPAVVMILTELNYDTPLQAAVDREKRLLTRGLASDQLPSTKYSRHFKETGNISAHY